MDFVRLLWVNSSGTAIANIGNMNIEVSILNPKRAMIHAVKVVQTFDPKMPAMDCASDIKTAVTKLTTITVEAEEL